MILETVLSDRYVCQISCFSPQVKYLGEFFMLRLYTNNPVQKAPGYKINLHNNKKSFIYYIIILLSIFISSVISFATAVLIVYCLQKAVSSFGFNYFGRRFTNNNIATYRYE